LTPIAADLGVSEGNTGQAISISGVVAVITRQQDRRLVVLALTRC
jgi:predicted MFS family arabinose efflux permease